MNRETKTQSGGLFTGAVISVMGLLSLVVTFLADTELLERKYAPRWVGICAASVFLLFGLSILQQSFIERKWLKRPLLSASLFTALIFTSFGIVLSWAVFGGNARSYISIPFVGNLPFTAGDSIARLIILLVAVIVDCAAILCWVLLFSRMRRK